MNRDNENTLQGRVRIVGYVLATLLLLSWLLHELAHYLTGRAFGYPMINTLNLGGVGGVGKFMIRAAFICVLISACVSNARAQSDSTHTDTVMTTSNAVFAELGGPALYYSFNYDRMAFASVGYRMGFGLVEDDDQHWTLMLPVFINWFPGASSRSTSKFELDAGFVYHSSGVSIWYETIENSGIFFSLGAGFRYQSADDGILFRLTFTPLFFSDQLFAYGGLSFGWAF